MNNGGSQFERPGKDTVLKATEEEMPGKILSLGNRNTGLCHLRNVCWGSHFLLSKETEVKETEV